MQININKQKTGNNFKLLRFRIEEDYLPKQNVILLDKNRYKIISKGRRFGFTRGIMKYIVGFLANNCEQEIYVMWLDTIYGNIERYYERYMLPELKVFDRKLWKMNKTKMELSFGKARLDFRSADKPENLEGFSYHLIVINEAGIVLKDKKLWYESVLPMGLDYKADFIIGGTPKGKFSRDGTEHLFYSLFKKAKKKRNYKAFQFTSYDNPIIDNKDIDELKTEIPDYLQEQEILGRFVDSVQSGIIKRNWFNYFSAGDLLNKRILAKIQAWDTAGKTKQENDYSVCQTWVITPDGYYLTDLFRDRLEFPELKKKAIELYEKHNPNYIWIEDKSSGTALIQELRRETRIPIKEIKAITDKIQNVNACSPIIESGRVHLLIDAEWIDLFLIECEQFPQGEFDDQIDIMSKFLNEAKKSATNIEPKITTIPLKKQRKTKYRKFHYK